MTIKEKQDTLIEDFEVFNDWMDKYEYIIQLGKDLPPIEEQYKTEDNLIKGCQSRVWLHADFKDGKLYFTADSDALITKGLVSMVVGVLSGHTPKEIVDADIYFIDAIGLRSHLSPTRSNGLLSMLKQIKLYAVAYLSKSLQNS
jgi:cysteine desulfuration protein SufE